MPLLAKLLNPRGMDLLQSTKLLYYGLSIAAISAKRVSQGKLGCKRDFLICDILLMLIAASKSYRVDPCCWRPGPLSLVCNALSQPGALCSPICQAHQHMHAPPPATPSLCSDPPSRHKARSPDASFPFPGHYWAIKAWSGIWRSEAKEAILR